MYYGYGGGKPGTTKKPGTTPRFFSRPRPPVRFYTVEALCRYVLFHSTPPFSSSSLIREVHCGKSTQSPAVMQKVRGRHDPHLNPLSSRISPCSSPASLLLHRKILFAQNPRYRSDHRLFYTPAHHVAQTYLQLFFLRKLPPKSLRWFGTHGLRPCKTATTTSDTIRRPVCTMPFHAPTSHHGTNCPAFSCHTSCIK